MKRNVDVIKFKRVDLGKLNESWFTMCGMYYPSIDCVDIEINGISLYRQLSYYLSFRKDKGYAKSTYGHATAMWYQSILDRRNTDYNPVELFCCFDCGEPGCTSPTCEISQDERYVYWKNFGHTHNRISYMWREYCFDRNQYYEALDQLKKDGAICKEN